MKAQLSLLKHDGLFTEARITFDNRPAHGTVHGLLSAINGPSWFLAPTPNAIRFVETIAGQDIWAVTIQHSYSMDDEESLSESRERLETELRRLIGT